MSRSLVHLTTGAQLVVNLAPAELRERVANLLDTEDDVEVPRFRYLLVDEDAIRIDQIAAIVPPASGPRMAGPEVRIAPMAPAMVAEWQRRTASVTEGTVWHAGRVMERDAADAGRIRSAVLSACECRGFARPVAERLADAAMKGFNEEQRERLGRGSLIVARTRELADAARQTLRLDKRTGTIITQGGVYPLLDGFLLERVFWIEGWETGNKAAEMRALVQRHAAKRGPGVVEDIALVDTYSVTL